MKPKTIQEVSQQIRSAGVKDDSDKEETAPPKKEEVQGLGEKETTKEGSDNDGDGDSVVEPPTPVQKDPAEMEKNPNEFLDPAPVEPRAADDVEPGTEPNIETDENLEGDKNKAPENKINEDVVNDMGGGTLNDALKKTFGDFLEGKRMSKLGGPTLRPDTKIAYKSATTAQLSVLKKIAAKMNIHEIRAEGNVLEVKLMISNIQDQGLGKWVEGLGASITRDGSYIWLKFSV